jgi:hypothetical protein
MKTGSAVDRRTFLRLGAAGTALMAAHPRILTANGAAETKQLMCPPSLDALAADRLTYRFRDLFNCPATMNELGYAQVGKSVSAITAISFPPYACCGVPEVAWSLGFLLTCELFLDGRFSSHRRAARREC